MTNAKQFNLKPSYEEILKYYDVNQKGQVFKIKTGKRIKSHLKKGYERVAFTIEGKRFMYTVHRMVAVKYLPNPYKLAQVNHLDANKTNNNIENLQWVNQEDNNYHYYAKIYNQNIEERIHQIFLLHWAGVPVSDISKILKMKYTSVNNIISGESFSQIHPLYNNKQNTNTLQFRLDSIKPKSIQRNLQTTLF